MDRPPYEVIMVYDEIVCYNNNKDLRMHSWHNSQGEEHNSWGNFRKLQGQFMNNHEMHNNYERTYCTFDELPLEYQEYELKRVLP